jgi:lysyl-tRNA synthetase class 2
MKLKYQFLLIQAIRDFFNNQGFVDVITPPMVENPGMETHIHPFQIFSANKKQLQPLYLHTSPEFMMKSILAQDFEDIFTICYSFRDEPKSDIHRPQFLMLEWYRTNSSYLKIMDDCEELIKHCLTHFKNNDIATIHLNSFPRITMQEIFLKYLEIDILNYLTADSIKTLIKNQFPDVPLPESQLPWEDYFFLLFLNKIEPEISKLPYLLIYEFPAPLAALSTLKSSDPRVCERFEIYMHGMEICNCFNECTSLTELQARFNQQSQQKKQTYGYELPEPSAFYRTMENYPPSAGNALGVERLLKALTQIEDPFFN